MSKYYKNGYIRIVKLKCSPFGLLSVIHIVDFMRTVTLTLFLLLLVWEGVLADETGDADLSTLPVLERSHPHLQPSGLSYKNLFIYPSVKATHQFDSNVFASPDFDYSDRVFILSPSIRFVKSGARAKHELQLSADHIEYDRFHSENRTSASARLQSERQIDSTASLGTIFEAASRFEPRDDPSGAQGIAAPTSYRDLRAETVITKSFNDIGIALGGSVRALKYDDGLTVSSALLDQSFRDGFIFGASVKPFYSLSPDTRAFVRLDVNQRDFEGEGSKDRDSRGYDAAAGFDFRLSPLLFGSISIGYLEQIYKNSEIPAISGPSISANLTWLLSPLSTMTAFSSRTVAETAAFDRNGRVDLTVGMRFDYEIRRNLVASLAASRKTEYFTGTDREDEVFNIYSGINYSINKYFIISFDYNFLDRDSDFRKLAFERHIFSINFRANY